VPLTVAAAVCGYFVGRIVEHMGPIDTVAIPPRAFALDLAVALIAAVLAVVVRHDWKWHTVALAVALVLIATILGNDAAFNTIAGSKDCPGTQDCDTLMAPFLMPLVGAVLVGAVIGAAGAQLTLAPRPLSSLNLSSPFDAFRKPPDR
jgi:hypothetical protein